MTRQVRFWSRWMLAGSLLSLLSASPSYAQDDTLTRAEVYRLQNSVQLMLRNQQPRPARLQDVLTPLDALQTARSSIAELLFNEGSIARVDQNTTFRFERGMRRFQLPNRVAMAETVFVLDSGTALIMSPPGGVGTEIKTPESQIYIRASDVPIAATPSTLPHLAASPVLVASRMSASPNVSDRTLSDWAPPLLLTQAPSGSEDDSGLLQPPQNSSAVMVVHDATNNTTQVFALTDGDITVSGETNAEPTELLGGQTVAIANGQVGQVQEFDLERFYQTVPLAAGLGPDQDPGLAQQPPAVQTTLSQVRVETLAALRRQARDESDFSQTFLQDALNGTVSDYYSRRGRSSTVIVNPDFTNGTFIRQGEDRAVFIPNDNPNQPIDLTVDFENGTIAIDGQSGVAQNASLGRDAVGTIILRNGEVRRIEVFGVNGQAPDQNEPYRGRLTTGVARDR